MSKHFQFCVARFWIWSIPLFVYISRHFHHGRTRKIHSITVYEQVDPTSMPPTSALGSGTSERVSETYHMHFLCQTHWRVACRLRYTRKLTRQTIRGCLAWDISTCGDRKTRSCLQCSAKRQRRMFMTKWLTLDCAANWIQLVNKAVVHVSSLSHRRVPWIGIAFFITRCELEQ